MNGEKNISGQLQRNSQSARVTGIDSTIRCLMQAILKNFAPKRLK